MARTAILPDWYGQAVTSDEQAMDMALALAQLAGEQGEVPVGAVVVRDGQLVGMGANCPIGSLDPSAHAEMMAVRDAARRIGNYRLTACTLYVTLEPCTMCTGALMHSRIERLVYGATEPKAGAIVSALQLPLTGVFNHSFVTTSGVREQECSRILTEFFARRREAKKRLRELAKDGGRESAADGQ